MSKLSPAQKTRIGVFLVVAAGLTALTLFVKLSDTLFADRDHYVVRVKGGVGGLQAGADVTYNGIVVGKVEDVKVDPRDVAVVKLDLGLREGTPVPEDAVATVVLQGISGQRRVDLSGGTNEARLRKPGEEIPAGQSVVDEVVDTVKELVGEVKEMTKSVSRLVSGDAARRIEATLANVEAASGQLALIMRESGPRVAAVLDDAQAAARGVTTAFASIDTTVKRVQGSITKLDRTLASVDDTARTIDELTKRDVVPLVASARAAIEHIEAMVGRADGAIGRAQTQLQTIMDDVSDGVRDVADLATMLKADPSSLVQGRSWPARELP
ncbi:MAG: MCE family protein [Deltaproteobacteria bacterium]|nr:MCE family protein [Deltaproteobacteria bacterium]